MNYAGCAIVRRVPLQVIFHSHKVSFKVVLIVGSTNTSFDNLQSLMNSIALLRCYLEVKHLNLVERETLFSKKINSEIEKP
jgi:hypothetical protein